MNRGGWICGVVVCAFTTLGVSNLAAAGTRTAAAIAVAGPGTPITDPDFDPPVTGGRGPVAGPTPKVLFLNFDGGLLEFCGPGNDDPTGNCSTIFQGTVLPFSGDDATRATVVQSVRADVSAFDITVTDQRPPEGTAYDMEMVGDWFPTSGAGFAGIAPKIDCFDGDGSDLSFTLDSSQFGPDVAKVILQEVAHTWGLEHVDSPASLLYPTTGGAADPVFEDACSPIVRLAGGGVVQSDARCPEQHAEHCSEPNTQNAYQEILTLFGPAPVDMQPPEVSIVFPADGAHAPSSFDLVVEIADDVAPQHYATTIEFEGLVTTEASFSGPGVFPVAINDLPDGHWVVRVTAQDEAGNAATAEIEIDIGEAGAEAVDDSTGDDAQASAGQSDTSGDDGATAGSETDGPAQTSDDEGCACRLTAPSRPVAPWLLVLVLLGPGRRRLGTR